VRPCHAINTLESLLLTRWTQYCNSGTMNGCDGNVYAEGTENFMTALDCVATRANCGSFVPPAAYPAIRGVMTWSINWDASNGYNFASTVAAHLATLP
jgi:chitinase